MNTSMKFLIIPVVFLFCSGIARSQSYDLKYSEDFRDANEYILAGDYKEALPLLLQLENSGQGNANVYYKTGFCYLNLIGEKRKAIVYFKKAATNITANYTDDLYEKRAPLEALLYLGDAYKVNRMLPDAESSYKKYFDLVDGIREEETARKRIFECQIAQLMMKRPNEAVFEKLNDEINNGETNSNVCISGDGKTMVFSRKMKFYDDILYTTLTDTGWSQPVSIMLQIGSDGEFYPTSLSYNGTRMLLSSFNSKAGTDIYESILKANDKWLKCKLLDPVNTQHEEIDAVYSPDDKYIYFASNRPNGKGGFDLYRASIDIGGNIGPVENLDYPVNTDLDEKSPAFLDNGNILVFSSQRKPGLGGFDYFYCSKESLGWGDVYNVGYPLSTVEDDAGLSTLAYKNEAMLAKHDAQSSAEEEIYKVNFTLVPKFKLVPVRGDIDIQSGNLKGATLLFIDNEIKDTVARIENISGSYAVDLYPGNFTLLTVNGTNVKSSAVTIPVDHPEESFTLPVQVAPEATGIASATGIAQNDTLVLPIVLFSFDKSSLSSEGVAKLNAFIEKIKGVDNVNLELAGFTDNIGNANYNLRLSHKRAISVRDYLVRNGIPKANISVKGLGFSLFIARNRNANGTDNPAGRHFNRRVEIRVGGLRQDIIGLTEDIVPQNLKP